MPLTIEALDLPEVRLVIPQRFPDGRGYFVESYNRRAFEQGGITAEFCQDNQSLSTARGTVRGLHFQLAPEPQAKLVRVLAGKVYDVAVDLRAGSPTYGRWCGATLTAEGGEQLFIPVGFAHAFCTLMENTLVAYKVDGFYNKSAEGGIRFDDPDVGIEWPISAGEIKLSEKDAQLPFLRHAPTPFDFGR